MFIENILAINILKHDQLLFLGGLIIYKVYFFLLIYYNMLVLITYKRLLLSKRKESRYLSYIFPLQRPSSGKTYKTFIVYL